MKKLYSEKHSSTADEHILVCLSPSPTNAKIVRTTAEWQPPQSGDWSVLVQINNQCSRRRNICFRQHSSRVYLYLYVTVRRGGNL